ncbi:MAG: hypothetical protein IKO39_01060, partial [Treponema sp.]|nr:hypothetical protein [Treponema sp.]
TLHDYSNPLKGEKITISKDDSLTNHDSLGTPAGFILPPAFALFCVCCRKILVSYCVTHLPFTMLSRVQRTLCPPLVVSG